MKSRIILLIFINLIGFISYSQEEKDQPLSRAAYDERLIMPYGVTDLKGIDFWKINEEVEQRAKNIKNKQINASIPEIIWQEQGPFNIGGRVRAIMFDPNTANKIWAGGAGGGLWYKTNYTEDTTPWVKINDFWENLSITTIAYDPTNTQVFYVGTGERRPGSGNWRRGGGIWKSTNGGVTWSRLPDTIPTDTDDRFWFIQKIAVNSLGNILAATNKGVYLSNDGGVSWVLYSDVEAFFDDLEIGSDGTTWVSHRDNSSSKIKKRSLLGNSWTNVTPPYTGNGQRIEIALAASTSGNTQVAYAICADGNADANVPGTTTDILWFRKTVNGGSNWTSITPPNRDGGVSFTFPQIDYDLTLAVHPTNSSLVIAGGTTNSRSTNGGTSWVTGNYGANMHPDQHFIVFNPNNNNDVLFGNDGGVYLCSGYGNSSNNSPTFSSRNYGFRVTEFYRTAIKNVANDLYSIGGSQDNSTIRMNSDVLSDGSLITCCDGMYCFIDQNQPSIQIVSIQNINHYLYNETTNGLTPILESNESQPFVNPCDYDSQNNIFYAYAKQYSNKLKLYRISGIGGTRQVDSVIVDPYFTDVSYIKVGKTLNTLFIGASTGAVYKVTLGAYDAANDYYPATRTILSSTAGYTLGGWVHSIEIGADDNELIVVQSAYGIKSVFYTSNGGTSWQSKDEATHGLPNIPIYDAVFNPTNRKQVLLATELGVFSTMDITATNPEWEPTDAQLAHVRCMRFVVRTSDNTVALATHGRGIFRTKFNSPCPVNRNIVVLPPGSGHYEASSTITSDTSLPESASLIRYDAGQKVSLKSGFKVKAGTHFKAYIDGCGGSR